MLNGEKESSVSIVYLTETEQMKEVKVQRERLKGETINIGKNYPEQFMRFESVSINDEVGFIKFNLFALPIIEKFCAALTELKDKKRLSLICAEIRAAFSAQWLV
jgi:C-terminal processing protease CtpA/Prc